LTKGTSDFDNNENVCSSAQSELLAAKKRLKTSDLKNYAQEFREYLIDDLKPNVKIFTNEYDEESLVKGIFVICDTTS
jgi:hypothetical protein